MKGNDAALLERRLAVNHTGHDALNGMESMDASLSNDRNIDAPSGHLTLGGTSALQPGPTADLKEELKHELTKLKLVVSPLATNGASRLVAFNASRISTTLDRVATDRSIAPTVRLVFVRQVEQLFSSSGLTDLAASYVRKRGSYRSGLAGSHEAHAAILAEGFINDVLTKVERLARETTRVSSRDR